MTSQYQPLANGDRIVRYVVNDVLGQGGFGMVYQVQHKKLGYQAVIKEFMPSTLARRQSNGEVTPIDTQTHPLFIQFRESFYQECRTLMSIEHANIITVYDAFSANNTAYMVMHLEVGKTFLDYMVKHQQSMAWRDITPQISGMLCGLEYLHSTGMVHRDVKPSNIFIRDAGFQALLIDFGTVMKTSNKSAEVVYSNGYAPLEQTTQGMGDIGTWTDVYGAAATIIALLTYQSPPCSTERYKALQAGQVDPITPFLAYIGQQENVALANALQKAISLDIANRTATIAEFKHDLGFLA